MCVFVQEGGDFFANSVQVLLLWCVALVCVSLTSFVVCALVCGCVMCASAHTHVRSCLCMCKCDKGHKSAVLQ